MYVAWCFYCVYLCVFHICDADILEKKGLTYLILFNVSLQQVQPSSCKGKLCWLIKVLRVIVSSHYIGRIRVYKPWLMLKMSHSWPRSTSVSAHKEQVTLQVLLQYTATAHHCIRSWGRNYVITTGLEEVNFSSTYLFLLLTCQTSVKVE